MEISRRAELGIPSSSLGKSIFLRATNCWLEVSEDRWWFTDGLVDDAETSLSESIDGGEFIKGGMVHEYE